MILGLTGGIGCGKSTVGAILAELGWGRIDTDAIVRELLEGDAATIAEIRAGFGEGVVNAAGTVDRPALAAIVFPDGGALSRLEGILHPRVRARWKSIVASGRGSRWVVEIPLLFEKGLEKEVDFTACVASDGKVQAHRLAIRGLSPQEVAQRMARQLPLSQKIERADFVLTNNGSLAFLRDQVTRLANALTQSVA